MKTCLLGWMGNAFSGRWVSVEVTCTGQKRAEDFWAVLKTRVKCIDLGQRDLTNWLFPKFNVLPESYL